MMIMNDYLGSLKLISQRKIIMDDDVDDDEMMKVMI